MGNKPAKNHIERNLRIPQSPYDAEPDSRPMTPVTQEREERRNKLRKMSVTSMFTDISKYYDIDHKEIGHGQYGIVRYFF